MSPPSEREALSDVAATLAELLAIPVGDLQIREPINGERADLVAVAGPFTFLAEWKGSGSAASVMTAIDRVQRAAERIAEPVIPLVAVAYMGVVGRRLCAEAGVAWLDLSGNAEIVAPGLRIYVAGRPNRFKRRGRPANVFAAKSSRIARWLLIHAGQALAQRELARATGVDEGFTSRIVGRLEHLRLVARAGSGAVQPRDPDRLLEAWRETYDFSKHSIVRGHVTARSGEALLHSLAETLDRLGIEHAATGLGAAWLLTHFATFRTVTLYLHERLAEPVLGQLAFREETRGANVWLVVPNDEGVFHGAEPHDGVRCVHPVQVYLDLGGHPERSREAADRLRSEHLRWRDHD